MFKRAKEKTKGDKGIWSPLLEDGADVTAVPPRPLWEQLELAGAQQPQPELDLWQLVAERLNPYKFKPERHAHVEIEAFASRKGDAVYYMLHNLRDDTYMRLSEAEHFVWHMLDGQTSVRDVAVAYTLPIMWQSSRYIAEMYKSHLTSSVLLIAVYPFVAVVAFSFVITSIVLIAEFFNLMVEIKTRWTH